MCLDRVFRSNSCIKVDICKHKFRFCVKEAWKKYIDRPVRSNTITIVSILKSTDFVFSNKEQVSNTHIVPNRPPTKHVPTKGV